MTAYLNQIATAVPGYDVHASFVRFAGIMLQDRRTHALFGRMAARAAIDSRYSCMRPAADPGGPEQNQPDRAQSGCESFSHPSVDADGLFTLGRFPGTGPRMALFEQHAPALLRRTLDRLQLSPQGRAAITHVLITTCTGFTAPGLDFTVVDHLGLDPAVERVVIGFMGCYAAITALRTARHIVRSDPQARVLIVNLELCTLHLQETADLEQVLSFLVFGDGCAASLMSAEPRGLALERFKPVRLPDSADLITWRIGAAGFDMRLSGAVPGRIAAAMRAEVRAFTNGADPDAVNLWAVHPGGRSVLDAVQAGLGLPACKLAPSRAILARFGNMSSATIMFVLQAIMAAAAPGQSGCAMSFGPGVTAETMMFRAV